jgi:hypothetical protein
MIWPQSNSTPQSRIHKVMVHDCFLAFENVGKGKDRASVFHSNVFVTAACWNPKGVTIPKLLQIVFDQTFFQSFCFPIVKALCKHFLIITGELVIFLVIMVGGCQAKGGHKEIFAIAMFSLAFVRDTLRDEFYSTIVLP